MMTAADSLEERLAGFDAGTDDYVVKPFALQEIEARMRALLRRSALPHGDDCLQFGAIKIYPGLRTAYREDKVLELTQMAFRILQALVRVAPNVLTRAELEEILWGDEPPGSDSLRSHVFSLRQTLDRPFEKPMLRTIRGVGLQLVDT
jgi:DNA-binding response OmpR family regulator